MCSQFLHVQCSDRDIVEPLAAYGRPPGPGEQVDQEHGEKQQAGSHQTVRSHLSTNARKLSAGWIAISLQSISCFVNQFVAHLCNKLEISDFIVGFNYINR